MLGLVLLLVAGCDRKADKTELLVFAAASLSDALTTVGRDFEHRHPEVSVRFSFGGSNQMARQLVASPKADLFVSASEAWMDRVAAAGHLDADTRADLLENHLVVITRQDSPLKLSRAQDLADTDYSHLVLADPEAVPAGVYAKQWLESRQLWARVSERVLPMPDVRAALGQVRRGKDLVGIVYLSDARSQRDVHIAFQVKDGPKIRYPAALIAGRPHSAEARALLDYLRGPTARRVFSDAGFVPLGSSD